MGRFVGAIQVDLHVADGKDIAYQCEGFRVTCSHSPDKSFDFYTPCEVLSGKDTSLPNSFPIFSVTDLYFDYYNTRPTY